MQLTCPKCAARFLVEAGVISPEGRVVRCGRCRHEWIALPTVEAVAPPAPTPPVETPRPSVLGAARAAAPPLPAIPRSHRVSMPAMLGWVVLGLVVVALIGGVLQRKALMASYPGTVPIFAAFGLAPVVPARAGLVLEDLSSSRIAPGGTPTLVVEGRIVNTASEALDVPTLKGTLRDATMREVQSWTFDAVNRRLSLGESTKFRTELPNPVAAGTELSIDFVAR